MTDNEDLPKQIKLLLPNVALRTRWIHPQQWYLCHRGADPSVIAEIIAVMHTQYQQVIAQQGNGLTLTFPEFRTSVREAIEGGQSRVIVLINGHFPGPVCRQTLSPVFKAFPEVQFREVRTEPCSTEGIDYLAADLVDLDEPAARIEEILKLAPHAREELM